MKQRHPAHDQDTFRTVGDGLLEQPCLGYSVQAPIGDADGSLRRAQQELRRLLDVPLFMPPLETLHLSLHSIVAVRSDAADKEQTWRALSEPFHRTLDELAGAVAPFDLEFAELRVMPSAVVAVAVDPSGSVTNIRARLLASVEAQRNVPAYDIVHTTLARFRSHHVLSASTVARAESIRLSACVRIAELRLVRELVYPSLAVEDLASVRLVAGSRAPGSA